MKKFIAWRTVCCRLSHRWVARKTWKDSRHLLIKTDFRHVTFRWSHLSDAGESAKTKKSLTNWRRESWDFRKPLNWNLIQTRNDSHAFHLFSRHHHCLFLLLDNETVFPVFARRSKHFSRAHSWRSPRVFMLIAWAIGIIWYFFFLSGWVCTRNNEAPSWKRVNQSSKWSLAEWSHELSGTVDDT